ncbi:uncharacterized protein SOCG_02966 [Schizosaccharomyces octosporus yFS286]|uniref:Distal membrane-arm assembly complex protein 1-like domain-containing protein n=1 Tax=Schizosaccharomyces octosporus (strain yFS286) TaxID=483514 RepID=S9Q214_SCHOY|nr:uncharacterized protein SOCG_02966 [Schizosaccharomyces octosporus yFS286]EPX73748.1 hypothetical protein SOCG_02966 [Schizosaccharomyces octosporus yFS286]
MASPQSESSVDLKDPKFEQYDCLPCRLVGATAFTGLGVYAYWQSNIPRGTPFYRTRRLGILSLATGFVGAGLYRLIN